MHEIIFISDNKCVDGRLGVPMWVCPLVYNRLKWKELEGNCQTEQINCH